MLKNPCQHDVQNGEPGEPKLARLISELECVKSELARSLDRNDRRALLQREIALINAALSVADPEQVELACQNLASGKQRARITFGSSSENNAYWIGVEELPSEVQAVVLALPRQPARKGPKTKPHSQPASNCSRKRSHRRKRSRTRARQVRHKLVAKDAHCQQCGRRVVDARKLRQQPGVEIVELFADRVIYCLQCELHEDLIATIHHLISVEEWRIRGLAGSPDRASNLSLLCLRCHQAAHDALPKDHRVMVAQRLP